MAWLRRRHTRLVAGHEVVNIKHGVWEGDAGKAVKVTGPVTLHCTGFVRDKTMMPEHCPLVHTCGVAINEAVMNEGHACASMASTWHPPAVD